MRSVHQLMGGTHRLIVFDAIVRTESFTRAAIELGVTQPAISRQIALLEDHLQCELFRRERNRVSLSPAGRALHQHVARALAELEAGVAEIRGHSDELTLAVQPAIADSWYSPRLDSLRAALSPSSIRLVIYDRDDELPLVEHDVSIRFGSGKVGPGLRSMLVVNESVVPVAAPELAQEFSLHCDVCADLLVDGPPLLRVDPDGRQWLTWTDWFAANGLDWSPPTDEITHRNYAILVQQALSGRGVVLGWRSLLGDIVDRGMLEIVGPRVDRPGIGYYLAWPSGLNRHDGLRKLTDWTVATVTEFTSP